MRKNILLFLFSVVVLVSLSACTESSGGSDDNSGSTPVDTTGPGTRTNCGVLVNGELFNPVPSSAATPILGLRAILPNRYAVLLPNGEILVTLQGININERRLQAALDYVNGAINQQSMYFEARSGCTEILPDGGVALVGQIVTSSGDSISEELIDRGFVSSIKGAGGCGEELLAGCYGSLLDDANSRNAGPVRNFLWKPVSERDGRLVVLVEPFRATVIVNGTELANSGPSNGRGTTARSNQSGCAFGANVNVQVLNSDGLPYTFPGGERSITIPNGCDRVEVNN